MRTQPCISSPQTTAVHQPLPPLKSAKDKFFPTNYLRANKYLKAKSMWFLSQPPLDKDTLHQCQAQLLMLGGPVDGGLFLTNSGSYYWE